MVSKKIVEAALLDGSSCSVLVLETAVLVRALSRSTPSTSWTFVTRRLPLCSACHCYMLV